ncbi:hypothetical protein D9757_007467 [Collybiopsis confluens]|uniref:Uncharacterized protein n=1 Tax=Collybiopsis confluens TaxID=2823264 RepID=A0A8H5HK93_9AGAR|nr:hypothetical protein D9757_007467 [Collybiopsis confluens]
MVDARSSGSMSGQKNLEGQSWGSMTYSAAERYSSELVGELIGAILFGFYSSVAVQCTLILWNKVKSRQRLHPYLLVTHSTLVLLVTMRTIVGLIIIIMPTVNEAYTHSPTCSPMIIHAQADSHLWIQDKAKYYRTLGDLTTAFAGVTLVINVFNTVLIVYRIWALRRKIAVRINPSNQLSTLAIALIQSDIQTPFIGIMFTHVIVSVCQDPTRQGPVDNKCPLPPHENLRLPTVINIQTQTGVTTHSERVMHLIDKCPGTGLGATS